MFDPWMIGAALGALTNRKDPIGGAISGGILGHAGGNLLGKVGGAGGTVGGGSPAAASLMSDPTAHGVAMEAATGGINPAQAAKMAGLPQQAASALANPGTPLAGMMSPQAQYMARMKKNMPLYSMMMRGMPRR